MARSDNKNSPAGLYTGKPTKIFDNKRVISFFKGDKAHLDDFVYPQSALGQSMVNWDFENNKQDDFSDDLKIIADCRITLEWDDVS